MQIAPSKKIKTSGVVERLNAMQASRGAAKVVKIIAPQPKPKTPSQQEAMF